MPFRKIMRGVPSSLLAAEGLMYHDWEAMTPSQRACTARLGITIQQEQEAYLLAHPEVRAMLEILISKTALSNKRKDILKEVAEHFTRPDTELDAEIRERLNLPPKVPYTKQDKTPFKYKDLDLEFDLKNIILKHYPPPPWKVPTPSVSTPDTVSSSFISIITSDTTLPTPEPIPTPEPTVSQTFFGLISNTVDKAIFLHVDDYALRYDTAYVELMRAVEEAMEIPVTEIKEDIAELYYNAYKLFELDIMEKERIAAEIAWDKRMRKKLKRTLRRQKNFRGYHHQKRRVISISSFSESIPVEVLSGNVRQVRSPLPNLGDLTMLLVLTQSDCRLTCVTQRIDQIQFWDAMQSQEVYDVKAESGYETPPTPKSTISSHESYKKPPQRPCICHPQFYYNRYPKDRFGIYMPRLEGFNDHNITVTPAISVESIEEAVTNTGNQQPEDTKSIMSNKSKVSTKSAKKAIIAD